MPATLSAPRPLSVLPWRDVPSDGGAPERLFTRAEVFAAASDAHSEGFKEGMDALLKHIQEEHRACVVNAMLLSQGVKDELEELGINVKKMYLRPHWTKEMNTLIIVDGDAYYGEAFMAAYRLASEARKEAAKEGYPFTVLFAPMRGSFNEDSVFADGYSFQYLGTEAS